MTVLARTTYNPATGVVVDTTSTSFVDVDAANLAVTFTAPASGTATVSLTAGASSNAGGAGNALAWQVRSGGSPATGSPAETLMAYNSPTHARIVHRFVVTGLTPGDIYVYVWQHARPYGSTSVSTFYGGGTGPAVMEVSDDGGGTGGLDTLPSKTVTTGTYTFVVADNGHVIEGDSTSAQTFTIPANATEPFSVGSIFEVYQKGTGQITIAAAPGVALRKPNGQKTAEQDATVSLRQRAANEWVLSGDTDGVGAGPQGDPGPTGPTGPTGPPGAASTVPGPQGDQGEAGGSILAAFWTYATATATPPTNGQVRSDTGNTNLYVAEIDTDGFNRAVGLATIAVGNRILVRAANGTRTDYDISGTPVDNGTWWTFPVTVAAGSGTVTKGARTQLNFTQSPAHGLPAGGATNQVLTKDSATDYDASWHTPPAGGGTGLLASKKHNPGTLSNIAATSTSFVDVDAANLAVTFTAPASGQVIVSLSTRVLGAASTDLSWGLRSAGADVTDSTVFVFAPTGASGARITSRVLITGLTAGASYTYTWSHARTFGSSTANTLWGGGSGPAVMEVWSA